MAQQYTPLTPCPLCRGTGKRKLAPHLLSALNAVRRKPGNCQQIWERLRGKASITGVQNRLSDLMRLGLVERTKDKTAPYVYSATTTTGGKSK